MLSPAFGWLPGRRCDQLLFCVSLMAPFPFQQQPTWLWAEGRVNRIARLNKEKYWLGGFELSGLANGYCWLFLIGCSFFLFCFVLIFKSLGFPSLGTLHLQIWRWAKGDVFCLAGLQSALCSQFTAGVAPAWPFRPGEAFLHLLCWQTPGMVGLPLCTMKAAHCPSVTFQTFQVGARPQSKVTPILKTHSKVTQRSY